MSLEALQCQRCGAHLIKTEDGYRCEYCGMNYAAGTWYRNERLAKTAAEREELIETIKSVLPASRTTWREDPLGQKRREEKRLIETAAEIMVNGMTTIRNHRGRLLEDEAEE